ncbi:DUF1918 domain-containing protein [Nannocystis exedens]|uniref:DUF1918 domain-containing protein n=1 Tax=Nannocystis exedens TaxID=54 RepID=UPI001B808EAD|nr:DUF1918 domain-containing protein [Nannocystis exedens]
MGDFIRVNALNAPLVGEIVEVLGPEESPAYRVRFPNGHEVVMTPSPDATIVHKERE